MRQRAIDCQSISLQAKPLDSIGVKPPVAKLVKSFGGLRKQPKVLTTFATLDPPSGRVAKPDDFRWEADSAKEAEFCPIRLEYRFES